MQRYHAGIASILIVACCGCTHNTRQPSEIVALPPVRPEVVALPPVDGSTRSDAQAPADGPVQSNGSVQTVAYEEQANCGVQNGACGTQNAVCKAHFACCREQDADRACSCAVCETPCAICEVPRSDCQTHRADHGIRKVAAESSGAAHGLRDAGPQPTMEPSFEPLPAVDGEVVPPGLALEDFESMALEYHPSLAQARARMEAAQGKWLQVGLRPNPVIGFSGEEIGASGTAGKQGGFIRQELVTAGKLQLRREVVRREIELAEQQWAAQELRVLTRIRSAFYDVLVAQQRVVVVRRIFESTDQSVETIRHLLEAGQATRIALLQAEVEAESNAVLLQSAENEQAAAWRRLAAQVGRPNLPQARLAGSVELPPEPPDWNTALARMLNESPELTLAGIQADQSRQQVSLARARAVPNLQISAGVQQDDETQDTISNVQFEVPLPVWNRNQGGIQQAEANLIAAGNNVERVELTIQERLAAVYQRLVTARQRAKRFQDLLLPKAEETLQLVITGYEAGELEYLSLLTAQRTYFQTSVLYLDALGEAWRAHFAIEGFLLAGEGNGTGDNKDN